MELRITIECDNAAFDDQYLGPEVARILRKLAGRIEDGLTRHVGVLVKLHDVNGNTVGTAEVMGD